MRPSHILFLVVGGALVALIALPGGPRQSPARAATAPSAAPDPGVDQIVRRLDELAGRFDEFDQLAERLDQMEGQIAELSEPSPTTAVVGPVPPVPTTLRLRARAFSMDPGQAAEAIKAWGAVAEATADPERRAEAHFEQGELYRKLEDWDAAAEAYRKVVELIGLGGMRGQTALYRKGWSETSRGDIDAAYQAFRRLAEAPGLPKTVEPTFRFQMASFAKAAGDLETARREFQRFIADYHHSKEGYMQEFVKHAGDRLRELE